MRASNSFALFEDANKLVSSANTLKESLSEKLGMSLTGNPAAEPS